MDEKITFTLVKELRERTGASIVYCKKILIESNGDIELAIENMRKSNIIKAAKKASNTTKNGLIKINIEDGFGIVLEVNCQTDFVAKNHDFQIFSNKVLNLASNEKITDIKVLKEKCEKDRIALVSKTGENINIHRLSFLKGKKIGGYLHDSRIGVLVDIISRNEELIKKIAMHIAASKPMFIKPENIPYQMIKKEYQIQLEIAMQSEKSKEIIEKIVKNRIKKFVNEISLTSQPFIFDQNKTVGQLLKNENAELKNFIRFEIGEKY